MDTLNLLMQGFITAATPINLMWAFVGCIIGTAVGVLPGIGPAVAAHEGSTLVVVFNALRLLRYRDPGADTAG